MVDIDLNSFVGGASGAALIASIIALGVIALLMLVAVYVYTALALQTIGKKLKYKRTWLAWIPVANIAMILQMGGFHWAWVFLLLIPVLGAVAIGVLATISWWRIFEKRHYPGWLALVVLIALIPGLGMFAGIAFLIILGMVAWKDRKKSR